ncbi:hypothetical protein ACRFDC_000176 [Campylobacter jejuni]
MNFLSSLKDKAVNASEAIKDKTIKTAEVVKDIGMEVKCGIGWHAGEYQNEKDKPKCFFSKICPDCGKYLIKNQHDFEAPEILNPDNCYGYRRCTLCSIQVFDNFHNYYEIKKDSKCRMHEKCNLCGHERLGQTRHNWKYDESGQKICLDCKETV